MDNVLAIRKGLTVAAADTENSPFSKTHNAEVDQTKIVEAMKKL